MSEYRVSEITRERILSAARKLFYDKGYKSTKYEEICREAGVNEGTLHYQFKSKAAVGKVINEQSVKRNTEEALLLLKDITCVNPLVPYALHNFIYWYKFYADEKYRRFAVEVASEYKYNNVDEYIRTYDPLLELPENSGGLSGLNKAMIISIDSGVPEYLKEHLDEFSYFEIAQYELLTYAKILGLDEGQMQKASEQAKEIIEKADPGCFYLEL